MFKYISEIIGKISVAQRIWALVFVLIAIVIVTLGPSTLDALSQDNEELEFKVERQRRQIVNLSYEVDSLNLLVVKNQRECTDRIIQREKEIYDQIERLELMIRLQSRTIERREGSTGGNEEMPSAVYLPDNSNQEMMDGLKKIKKDIRDHIKDCENGK
jgi:cell division protein FtsB